MPKVGILRRIDVISLLLKIFAIEQLRFKEEFYERFEVNEFHGTRRETKIPKIWCLWYLSFI